MTAREFFTFAELLRRVDLTIGYLRSAFDDPRTDDKMSMARTCAWVAMLAGIWTTAMTVKFAFALLETPNSATVGTGAIGILAGLATTLFATVAVGLLKRTTASGVTETIDDVPAPQPAQTVTTATTVQTGGTP
jgi:hypothetical protein